MSYKLVRIILSMAALAMPSLTFGEGASRSTRAKSNILIYADPVAFTPYFGQGINIGLALTGGLVVEGASYSGKTCTGDECQIETSLSEIRVKWFPGNSFFLNAGVGFSTDQWDHSVAWGHADEANADFKVNAKTNGVVAALGNLWHHGGFTIGCDWVGIYQPLKTTEFTFTEGDGYNTGSRESNERQANIKLKSDRVLLTRLHIGAIF